MTTTAPTWIKTANGYKLGDTGIELVRLVGAKPNWSLMLPGGEQVALGKKATFDRAEREIAAWRARAK